MTKDMDAIIDRMAEELHLEIPQAKVDNEAAAMRMELQYRMQYDRLASGNPYVDRDELERQLAAIEVEALHQVRMEMVLQYVVQAQGLTVTRQELDEEAAAIAHRQDVPLEMVKDFLGEDLGAIRKDLLQKKALEWLIKN